MLIFATFLIIFRKFCGLKLVYHIILIVKFIYLVAAALPTARGATDICRGEGADIKHNFLTTIY